MSVWLSLIIACIIDNYFYEEYEELRSQNVELLILFK